MFKVYQDEIKRLIQNIEALKQTLNQKSNELELLRTKYSEIEIIIKEKELIIEDIELKYRNLLNARTLNTGLEGKENAKTKINTLVREIDKCLALLND